MATLLENNQAVVTVGLLAAILLPTLPLMVMSNSLWLRIAIQAGVPEAIATPIHRKDLPFLIGCVERSIYFWAWLSGTPEVIGIWIVLKIGGSWKAWSEGQRIEWGFGYHEIKTNGRHEFNIFLLGTAFSLMNSVAIAESTIWFVNENKALALSVTGLSFIVTSCVASWSCMGFGDRRYYGAITSILVLFGAMFIVLAFPLSYSQSVNSAKTLSSGIGDSIVEGSLSRLSYENVDGTVYNLPLSSQAGETARPQDQYYGELHQDVLVITRQLNGFSRVIVVPLWRVQEVEFTFER